MFQTIRGPIMGRFAEETQKYCRLYAPAYVGQQEETKLVFSPLAFCEEYLDLYKDSAAVFGENSIPLIVLQGYEGYFNEFIKGSYRLGALVYANVGMEGKLHVVEDTRQSL